jgi:hypothetical protein
VVSTNNFAGDGQSPVSGRLAAMAQHLIEFGLPPHQIGPKLFEHLVAPDTDARSRIFRAGLGVRGPRSRREASALADYAERGVRGAPDLVFQRRILLGYLRGLLFQQCHDSAEDLRRDQVEVTPANLRTALTLAIVYARPRSSLVPWSVDERRVSRMIDIVVTDYSRRFVNDYQRRTVY